ncbi:hypothetical protein Tco_1283537 [Tanacetum coccineum]
MTFEELKPCLEGKSYEILEVIKRRSSGKYNEAQMTFTSNLPTDLLTQEYEKFLIFYEETIDSGFTRFNAIVTSLKSLDPNYSSKNHVRNFLHALPLKCDDSDSQDESDEDVDEEEAEAFNLLARNFRKFFCKGNRFGRGNQFSNGSNRFGKGRGNSFKDKGSESSKKNGSCYNRGIEGVSLNFIKPNKNVIGLISRN